MKLLLFVLALGCGFVGVAAFAGNSVVGVGALLIGLALLIAAFKKKRTSARVSPSAGMTAKATAPRGRTSRRKFSAVGNTDAVCPHCNETLAKKPGRKKKCSHCGQFIFVRTRPSDEQRVLVTESQAEEIEEQWSIVNGTHDEYLATKKRFSDEKGKLAKRFGREPSDNDVTWSLLNQDLMGHASQQNWGLFRNAKMEMADILRKEAKLLDALGMYCEVCYLDLNGPNNVGGITDRELLKQFPPWNPKQDAFLAPGIVDKIVRLIDKAEVGEEQVKDIFTTRASKLKDSLRLLVSVSKAWSEMRKALY